MLGDLVSNLFLCLIFLGALPYICQEISKEIKYNKWDKEKEKERKKKEEYAFRKLSDEEKAEIEGIKSEYINCMQIQEDCCKSFSLCNDEISNIPFSIYNFQLWLISDCFHSFEILHESLDKTSVDYERKVNCIKSDLCRYFRQESKLKINRDHDESIEAMKKYFVEYMVTEAKIKDLQKKMNILLPYCGPGLVPPILKDTSGLMYPVRDE